MIITVWTYFCALLSIPLVYRSIFVPVPRCLGHSGSLVYFEVRYCNLSSCVLVIEDGFVYP